MTNTVAELLELATTQQAELERLLADNAHLAAEARRLRKVHASERGDGRRIRQAYSDSVLLLTYRAGGLPTSRRRGPLSERRWQAAVALLRAARLHNGRIVHMDPETAMQRLQATYSRVLAQPVLWRMRLGGYDQGGNSPTDPWFSSNGGVRTEGGKISSRQGANGAAFYCA